jgi:hypothetical protein
MTDGSAALPERAAAEPVAIDGRWLRCYRRQPSPRLRVVCFPHAGGSASFFHPWLADLPPDVELVAAKYPGREDRMPEPPVDGVPELADALTDALRRSADAPLALFGHSLGAAVAYEVARRLERRGDAGGPALLAVSSFPGPQRVTRGMLHQASDETLADEVRRLGGTHAIALEHPELRALVLPVLRKLPPRRDLPAGHRRAALLPDPRVRGRFRSHRRHRRRAGVGAGDPRSVRAAGAPRRPLLPRPVAGTRHRGHRAVRRRPLRAATGQTHDGLTAAAVASAALAGLSD